MADRSRTLLYLIAPTEPTVECWREVLQEEGFEVIPISYPVPQRYERNGIDVQRRFGIITISIKQSIQSFSEAIRLCGLSDACLHIHYGPELEALGQQGMMKEAKTKTILHLAQNQTDEDLTNFFHSLPSQSQSDALKVTFPPLSIGDVEAEETLDGVDVQVYRYPGTSLENVIEWSTSNPFAIQTAPRPASSISHWCRSASGLSYTRTIASIKSILGPIFNLEALWERHTRYEFASRDAKKTMSTMIPQPYVNHVATMTGGSGYEELLRFYTYNFVTRSPPDTELIPISRTIGADRLVDELVFKCTHTQEIEYFLPGVSPTGKKVEIPMVAIVNFRGDKLAFESIYWDQANTLVQLGLFDAKNLPTAGVQVGRKVLDPYGEPSNTLFGEEANTRAKGFEQHLE